MHKLSLKSKPVRAAAETDILNSIKEIREHMGIIYHKLNFTSDELITDSLNYELMALKTRHKYFTEEAKKMNIKFWDIKLR